MLTEWQKRVQEQQMRGLYARKTSDPNNEFEARIQIKDKIFNLYTACSGTFETDTCLPELTNLLDKLSANTDDTAVTREDYLKNARDALNIIGGSNRESSTLKIILDRYENGKLVKDLVSTMNKNGGKPVYPKAKL